MLCINNLKIIKNKLNKSFIHTNKKIKANKLTSKNRQKFIKSERNKVLRVLPVPKNRVISEYICCSIEYLYQHLENQFIDNMSWDNRGIGGWEVDHRRPCASFNFNNEEEKYMCFHWTNLQPMWKNDNIKKGCQYNEKEFEYIWLGTDTGWIMI